MVVSLTFTIAGGYMARLSLVETTRWVTHTDEVKLAIDRCGSRSCAAITTRWRGPSTRSRS